MRTLPGHLSNMLHVMEVSSRPSSILVFRFLSNLGSLHSGEVNDGDTKTSRKSSKKDKKEGKDKSRKAQKQDSDATGSRIQHAARDEGRQQAI